MTKNRLFSAPLRRLLALLALHFSPPALSTDEVIVNGTSVDSPLTSVILMPGDSLEIRYRSRNLDDRLQVTAADGTLVSLGREVWLFQPPSGRWLSPVSLQSPHRSITVKVFLAEPLPADGTNLDGYALGAYPAGQDRPRGLLKVSKEDATQLVSTNLRLSDLVSQQPTQWPRYLTFSTALLEQLALIPRVLASAGFADARLSILSAYRTPTHNHRVGGAPRSRHIYGDAADLIIDTNDDGRMDDLNGDGETSRADVEWLIARLQRAGVPVAIGGVGSYESNGPAEAFLHIDARGRAADWIQ